MDRQKLAAIVLVTLAMLFLVSLGAGAGRDWGSTDKPPSIMKALRRLQVKNFLQVRPPVESACSRSPDVLVVDGYCEVTIPAAGFFSKPRRLALEEASESIPLKKLTVTFSPNRGTDQEKELSAADCIEIAVDRHGGRLELTCPGGSCRLELRDRRCPRSNE